MTKYSPKTKLYERTIGIPMTNDMLERLEAYSIAYQRPLTEIVRSIIENGLTAAAPPEPVRFPWERLENE